MSLKNISIDNKVFDTVIEILFLLIVFLTPTIFDRRIGIVFSLTKVTFLRIFLSVLLGVWALKLIILKEHKWIRTALDLPILTYMLVCTIATITSVHVYTSFTGFYGRFMGLTTLYNFALLLFITTNFINSRKQIERIFALVLLAGSIMGVYSIIQRYNLDPYSWGGVVTWERVIATIGQPNFLAAYVLMAFFLGLVLFLMPRQEKKFEKTDLLPIIYYCLPFIIYLFMIYSLEPRLQEISGIYYDLIFGWAWFAFWGLLAIPAIYFAYTFDRLPKLALDSILIISLTLIWICIFFTQSRGALLALLASGGLFLLLINKKIIFKNWEKFLAIAIAVFLVIAFVIVTMPEYSPFKRFTQEVKVKAEETEVQANEAASPVEIGGAAGSRIETWKSAFGMIADKPLFGIGPEVMKMVFPRYETDLFRFKEAFHVKQDRCHNEVFDVSVTEGVIGLTAYIWLLGSLFFMGFMMLKTEDVAGKLMILGLLCASSSYLFQNLFSFGVAAITSLFWIMIGLVPKVAAKETISVEAPKK